MSESAVEQNDGSAALRAATTVIYTRITSRIRDKRGAVRITFSTPRKCEFTAHTHTIRTRKGNIKCEYHQKLVDTS